MLSQPTNTRDEPRYLGIVADGPTDQEIMARFLKTLVEPAGPCEERIIDKDLSILMSEFRNKASRAGQYGLFDKPAMKLREGIVSVIHSAVGEFRDAISRDRASTNSYLSKRGKMEPSGIPSPGSKECCRVYERRCR